MESFFKDKSKLNLSIDIVMLLLILPIAGIGFLIKYVLIPGMERNSVYGSNFDLHFLGMTRHQWGTIHLILSIAFLGLLIIHIVSHWKMIVCIFRRMIPHRALQGIFAFLLVISGLSMIAFPLIVRPELTERIPLHQNREDLSVLNEDTSVIRKKEPFSDKQRLHKERLLTEKYEINGSMTLEFIAEKYEVPVKQIATDLNIPETYTREKLGRLKKHYSFTMDDVRNSITRLLKNKNN